MFVIHSINKMWNRIQKQSEMRHSAQDCSNDMIVPEKYEKKDRVCQDTT